MSRMPLGLAVLVAGMASSVAAQTPYLVKETIPGNQGAFGSRPVASMEDRVYFISPDPAAWRLWTSQGTEATTVPLGTFDAVGFTSVGVVGDHLLVGSSQHLYRTDGTVPGTAVLSEEGLFAWHP